MTGIIWTSEQQAIIAQLSAEYERRRYAIQRQLHAEIAKARHRALDLEKDAFHDMCDMLLEHGINYSDIGLPTEDTL